MRIADALILVVSAHTMFATGRKVVSGVGGGIFVTSCLRLGMT